MPPPMHPPRPLRRCCFVWLIAALAMVGQIVGAAARPEMDAASPFGIICGVDGPAPVHGPVHHHHHDCATCPLCAAAALHAMVLAPAPMLPRPSTSANVTRGLPPPARAPPSWRFEQPFPRGPPAFA